MTIGIVIAFVLGLLIGWLIEWFIDNSRWMRSGKDSANTAELEAKLATAHQEIETLKGKIAELESRPTEVVKEVVRVEIDDLEDVNGIGPVFAKRLNAAGVYTFAELAKLSPQRTVEIVQAKSWQAVDAADWLAEAAELAKAKSES